MKAIRDPQCNALRAAHAPIHSTLQRRHVAITMARVSALDWLLDADPAIRWQAMRDLTDASPAVLTAERARVPREGIAAAVLASQGADGAWHRDGAPHWLPTLFMPLLLRATRADRADPVIAAAIQRLAVGFRWGEEFGRKPFFEGEVQPCINGGALAASGYFGHPTESLARRLVSEQLEDGGWNCEAPKSARRVSSTAALGRRSPASRTRRGRRARTRSPSLAARGRPSRSRRA
jgi:hypothetical protein